MKRNKVTSQIKKNGEFLKKEWVKLAKKNNLKLNVSEFTSLPTFYFDYKKLNEKLYTIFTYEMLKKGYLASNSIYLSYAHKHKDLVKYLKVCNHSFEMINKFLKGKTSYKIKSRYQGFKRVN